MQFIDIPTEQTTAFTDILLSLVSITGVIWIIKKGYRVDKKKATIWVGAFLLLSIAAFLGAIAHGIKMPEKINQMIWHPLNLALGLSVACFLIGVIYDLQGFRIQKSLIIVILLLSLLFFSITLIYPGLFFVFIIYEGIAMLFSLISYAILKVKKKLPGASFMSLGILISIVAAILQTTEGINFQFIWIFNHNGLFHILQIIGLFFLFKGIAEEITSRKPIS